MVNKYYAIVDIGRNQSIRHALIRSQPTDFVNYFIVFHKPPENGPASDFQRTMVKSEPILHIMKNFTTFETRGGKKLTVVGDEQGVRSKEMTLLFLDWQCKIF